VTTAVAPAPIADPWRLGPASALLLKMIGFEPTGPDQAAILRCRKRFVLVVGGGQAGKSRSAAASHVIHVYEDRHRNPGATLLYWLVAADYERVRAEWNYIIENFRRLGYAVDDSKRVDPGRIVIHLNAKDAKDDKKPFMIVETKSGKDPRTLAMFSPHGIIVCEASQIDLDTYFKCLERVTASGGWLHMSGTYEYGSAGWYPGMAASWKHGTEEQQSFVLPSPTNKHVYPGGVNDPKIQLLKRESSDAFFLERIMGEVAAPKGAVFADEFRAHIHIRDLIYDPELPLYIWTDPGYNHPYAVEIAQMAPNGQIQMKDEVFERGKTTDDIIAICMSRPWWKNPHKTLVIDPNYAEQHQGTHSVAEIWLAKTQLATMGVKVGIDEGTERLKTFLKVNPLTGEPGIVFDPRCKGVLSELGAYPSPFYETPRWEIYSHKTDREGNVIPGDPDDKYNDGIKATIYGIVQHFGLVHYGESEHFTMKRHGGGSAKRSNGLRRQFELG